MLFINATLPIGRFFAATAVDYYWNPDAFSEIRSRRTAVHQFMGPDAVLPAERFYALRGYSYLSTWQRSVGLDRLAHVLSDLEAASLTPELRAYCWKVYEQIAASR